MSPQLAGDLREVVRATVEDYVRERTSPAEAAQGRFPAASATTQSAEGRPAKDFVCEEDVLHAVRNGSRIAVSARTIITPAARDAAEGRNVFIWD